jgi:hypothetical protein
MAVALAVQNLRADGDVSTEGGVEKMNVTNVSAEGLLTDILKELKKMNLHLSLMTDVVIKNTEVEI